MAFDRVQGQWDKRQDARSWERLGVSPHEYYGKRDDALERLHELIGAPFPCEACAHYPKLLDEIRNELEGGQSGDGAAGTDYAAQSLHLSQRFDTDVAVSQAIWCTTSHLRPERVVETGVARGITSRFILEALERNGRGKLWSIDLPHVDTTRFGQIGSAVPDRLRPRWTLLLGTSREHLPR